MNEGGRREGRERGTGGEGWEDGRWGGKETGIGGRRGRRMRIEGGEGE